MKEKFEFLGYILIGYAALFLMLLSWSVRLKITW